MGVTAAIALSSITGSTLGTGPTALAAATATVSCAASPPGTVPATPALASFTPTAPTRLVDTRNAIGGVDDPLGAGCTLRLDLDGAVPAGAEAVALSLTAIAPTTGFLTVHPCATGRLGTSNLNMRAGAPTPNLAVAIPDDDGLVCVYSSVETELLVDLTGWWTTDGDNRFTSVEPARVDDTRDLPGRPKVPAGTTHVIDLADEVPAGTDAIVGNLTIAGAAGRGFATAFPCGTATPSTSNVNVLAGEARASALIVGLDDAARLCVTVSVDAHVILDLAGYYEPTPFGPSPALTPEPGTRVADSRDVTGGWSSPFTPGAVRTLRPLAGRADAAQATAVVIDVVAVRAQAGGFVEIYPCDADDPETSVVNYTTTGATSNLATVELTPAGELCVTASSTTDVVIDLFGVLMAPDGAVAERFTLGDETWPPYSPDQADYAVRCGSDGAELELDLLSGTTAKVNGVPVAAGTIPLDVAAGDLTSVRLTRSGSTSTHWFRCVPDDFPRFDVERSADTTPGWYLTVGYVDGSANGYALIMDPAGAPVWYQRVGEQGIELRRRADGLLVHAPKLGPRYGVPPDGAYQVITLTGEVVDEIETVADPGTPGVEYPTDHHDMVDLSGGRSALLSYPLLPGQPLSVLGDGFADGDTIADNVIQEVGPDGDLLWTWRASEHFSYEEVTYPKRFPPVPSYAGDEVDTWHINSLGLAGDGSGDYIASARHLDAVFRIDRATGDVEWILGSFVPSGADPNPDGAQRLTIVGDPLGGPRRQHDARLDGNVLTLLDNRTDTGEPARAVAYEIDTGAGTATMLWSITTSSGSSSFGLGSHRTTFDGNTLVSWGNGPTPLFEEFSPAHESVLRFVQDGGGYSYRITKEPLSVFSAAVLRSTAGGSVG